MADLLTLIKAGKLFELQERLQVDSEFLYSEASAHCPLLKALQTGFHSMVEVLLKCGHWPQERIDQALGSALQARRLDLADLLLAYGADAAAIDFETVCRTVEPAVIERFLRAGSNPARDNAFARVLSEIKARPLLRLYRSLRDEFPDLHAQASLALADAVWEGKPRWVALLAWAGADPFMEVPDSIDASWEFGEEGGRVAAYQACWSENPEALKALNLKPTIKQTHKLLEYAVTFPNSSVVKLLLRHLRDEGLNAGDPPSSGAIEKLINHSEFHTFHYSGHDIEREAATCLELLLDAGGKWRPLPDLLETTRRALVRQKPRYIVRVIRLLVHTPDAADPVQVLELCRTPTLRKKIAECDRELIKDLDALKQQVRISADASTRKDTDP